MPRTKRSAEEKLEYYRKKFRKYENTLNNPECCPGSSPNLTEQTSIIDSSDCDEISFIDREMIQVDPNQDVDADSGEDILPVDPVLQGTSEAVEQGMSTEATKTDPTPPIDLSIDPELLKALGEATDDKPEFGEQIQANLAKLWLPLLKKGLAKEAKEKICNEYLVPENCKLLQAPKLNAEITVAVSELARNRDKKMTVNQQQLGVAVTAISKAMTTLLQSDDKVKAVKHLSNGCRLLCDLHFLKTNERIKLITSNLDKSFCQIIQDVDRDDTLFGNQLSDKIKASKAIERQGLQIKRSIPTPSTSQLATGRATSSNQGNLASRSRSSNRGGRGIGRRPYGSRYNRASQAVQQQPRSQHQERPHKTRAPQTQGR